MAWGMVDVAEQRMRFVVRASRHEKSMRELCAESGISRPTGYTWLRRYEAGGIAGVVEQNRRPQHSPGRTGTEIAQRVVELRRQRPDWGARKLQVLLAKEEVRLPVITIHRILLRQGLVRAQDRHRTAVQRFQRGAPNQLWQMDFKGPVGWQAPVGPLSIVDDHSRYTITLHGTWSSKAEPVREQLEEAFQRCRRFHGSLEAATQRRGWPWGEERQRWLDEFRFEYNHVRPHEALGMKTPATLWSKSARKYQPPTAAWEYEKGTEVRKLGEQGQLHLAGRRWEISRALAGEWVQLVHVEQRILVYYCRSLVRELDLAHQRSTAVDRWWDSNLDCKESPDNNV